MTSKKNNIDSDSINDFSNIIYPGLKGYITDTDVFIRNIYSFLSSVADVFLIVNTNSDILFSSNNKIFNFSEIKNFNNILSLKDKKTFSELINYSYKNRIKKEFEFKPVIDDDRYIKASLLSNKLAPINTIVVLLNDITEEVNTKQQRINNEALINFLMDSTIGGFVMVDNFGTIEAVNSSIEELFIYNKEELIGKNINILMPDKHKNAHNIDIEKINKVQTSNFFSGLVDFMGIKKDGSEVPIEITVTELELNNNKKYIYILRDITERIEFENALKENEEHFKNFADLLPQIIFEMDINGNLIFVNKKAFEIFGLENMQKDNIYSLYNVIDKKDHIKINDLIKNTINNTKLRAIALNAIKHDGSNFPTLLYSSITETEGKPVGIRGIMIDISEQKETEEELNKAKENAIKSEKSKELFLANMSHELRTPMNSIIGMTDLLTKTDTTDQQLSYINMILKSSQNLLVILNDILDISKIDSGELILEDIAFDVNNIIQNTIDITRFKADEKGLNLEFIPKSNKDIYIYSDPVRITQILLNLINNSIKFTQKGNITISVEILGESIKDITLRFIVKDTGIGIPLDKQELIFKNFGQADPTITRKYGGTGLGLSICKNLVSLLNGEIHLTSKVGKGSKFYFDIPFRKADANKIEQRIINEEQQHLENNSNEFTLEGKNILLAEDYELNQLMIESIAELWDCNLKIVDNGKKAVEEVKNSYYDLVLMDIQMPVMNGIEAMNMIRKIEDKTKRNIPIIAITANAIKGDAEKYLASGMDGYISKPYTEESLFKEICKVLNVNKNTKCLKNTLSSIETKGLYNLDTIRNISKGTKDFVGKAINIFVKQTTEELLNIEDAIKIKDYNKIYSCAHKIKPSFQLFNITSITDEIVELEKLAKSKSDIKNITTLFILIKDILEEIFTDMENESI